MQSLVLFDEPTTRINLLPFTFTRPLSGLRVGMLTIAEKWEKRGWNISVLAEAYLQGKFSPISTPKNTSLWINGALCPTPELQTQLAQLAENHSLWYDKQLIALRSTERFSTPQEVVHFALEHSQKENPEGAMEVFIQYPWFIFKQNRAELLLDFDLLTKGRTSQPITDPHTIVYGKENLFVEEGVSIRAAIINAENGPVYLGKGAKVREGSIINGAFALCENAELAAGSKIKGDTTVGPFARVGGEVSNSVFFGRTNKIHDGYLGNAVIGEWCNMGAATNNSNLKNTYSSVKVWNYAKQEPIDTGLQFCGLFMGDHSKCGINTMFNTGTVVGVAANVFGSGFPPKFIPSFAWGGREHMQVGDKTKIIALAKRMTERKHVPFTQEDTAILETIFNQTKAWRV